MNNLTKLMIGLALADLLAAIDNTAVSVAIPKIADTFNLTPSGISWMQTIYILALVIMLIPAGKIGDLFGHKRNMLSGFLVFGLASLGIIFTTSYSLLVFFRLLQGLAAAVLYTGSGAIIAHHWKKTELAFGITAAFFSIGLLIGPILAGVLTDINFSFIAGWHLIFAINIPIVIIAGWLVNKNCHETPIKKEKMHLDFVGLFLLVMTLTTLILRLIQNKYPVALITGFIVSIIVLLIYENNQKDPLIRLKIFKNKTFGAISAFTLSGMLIFSALAFINTFYLQDVLNQSATNTGIMMIPIFVGMGIFAAISGFYHNWRVSTIIASILILIGLLILSRVNPEVTYFKGLFWGYLIISAGGGFMMTNTFAAALGSVQKEFSGLATGYVNTAQQIGSLGGIAFVAGQDIIHDYQNVYKKLIIVACVALIASLFVSNKRVEDT